MTLSRTSTPVTPASPVSPAFSRSPSFPSHALDLAALRRLGLDAPTLERALGQRPHPAPFAMGARPGSVPVPRLARVVEVRRDGLRLHDGACFVDAVAWPALRARLQVERDALVVGDWVWFEASPTDEPAVEADTPAWVVARVPPRHRFTRRDPAGGLQPLVANVDTALLVMGLDRDFKLARLDRFLLLAQAAEADIVVVLTKADLQDVPDDFVDRVRVHTGDAWPVRAIDARDASARVALAPWLHEGRTLALLGSSGAGKSTLASTLAGVDLATGATRTGDDRGRHTTTTRTLHTTPSGACLVDTPGLRQLALDVDAAFIEEAFGDIAALAPQCRYRDCAHAGEPGCAVVARVPPERLRSFHKLLREAQRDELDVLARRKLAAGWKRQGKEGRARAADKRRVR
jgi:ribosome biogenesis GTPase